MASAYSALATEEMENDLASEPTPHWATTTIRVDGMTCGACSASIESAFHQVDGVGTVSVSLIMGRAVVAHDPAKISAEKVQETIGDRGFDAEVLSTDISLQGPGRDRPTTENKVVHMSGVSWTVTTIAVEGMTDNASSSAIEAVFKNIAGVRKAAVSLSPEYAAVEHDASQISSERVAGMIQGQGFGATVLETKVIDPSSLAIDDDDDEGQGASQLVRTTVAIEGMTCGACTSAVEKGFHGVDGMVQFNISLLAERAVVLHDSRKFSVDKVVQTSVHIFAHDLFDHDDRNPNTFWLQYRRRWI